MPGDGPTKVHHKILAAYQHTGDELHAVDAGSGLIQACPRPCRVHFWRCRAQLACSLWQSILATRNGLQILPVDMHRLRPLDPE